MTVTVNIHEAKTQLSKLVDQAAKGEAFVIAKARNSPREARDSVIHLKRYIKMLFERGETE